MTAAGSGAAGSGAGSGAARPWRGLPWVVAGGSALAAAVAVWRLAGSWSLPAYLGLVVLGAALAWIDLTQHRLPNRLVLPGVAASVPLLLGAALLDGDAGHWLSALGGGAALFVLYLVLALVSPRGLGMGDVKLAALLGLYAGYLGVSTVLVAALAGFLLGGTTALIGIIAGRATRSTAIPFGPWMLAGLWVAVAVASP